MAETLEQLHRRTLIVACDGTWFNSDRGYTYEGLFKSGSLQAPSNVTRICRAIRAESEDGKVSQIVYYQAGVGTGNSLWEKYFGGATGLGLAENCREAYSFLAHNYRAGDQIILIGFSRGAFTARSIADLIGCIGLLTKKGLGCFYEIFLDYENRRNPKYVPKFPNIPFENRPSFSDPRYTKELEARQLTRPEIPIKAVAVWDTVGSLGLPRITWLERLGIRVSNREFAFYDTTLNDRIENAFQVLALDEKRGPFSPAVWETEPGSRTHLKQVWLPGAHANAGGGLEDTGIADLSLAWMMDQLDPFIDFHLEYLGEQHLLRQQFHKDKNEAPRPWGCGRIVNSAGGLYTITGSKIRSPGHYFRVDPNTDLPTEKLLEKTNEYIHASVRIRYGVANMGFDDKGPYNPIPLKDWRLVRGEVPGGSSSSLTQGPFHWQYNGSDAKFSAAQNFLPEDVLGPIERELLRKDPQAYEKVLGTSMPEQAKEDSA